MFIDSTNHLIYSRSSGFSLLRAYFPFFLFKLLWANSWTYISWKDATELVKITVYNYVIELSILPRMQRRRHGGDPSALSYSKLRHRTEKRVSEEVEMDSYCLSDAGLTAVSEGFTKLEKLSLIWCSNVTSAGLKSIAEKCRFLRSLDLQVNVYLLTLIFYFYFLLVSSPIGFILLVA